MKRSYYTVATTLLPGWPLPEGRHRVESGMLKMQAGARLADARLWKDPPHKALANLGCKPGRSGFASEADILWFVKQYGALGRSAEELAEPGGELWLNGATFRATQVHLRSAWEKRDHRLFIDPGNFGQPINVEHVLPVNWETRRGVLEMRVATWHDYVAILLARDIAEKRAKVCQNPECPAPYFIAERRDAKYCSHPCAVLVNVHAFRARQKRRKNESRKARLLAKRQG